eukprot:gene16487-biopygen9789
MLADQSTGKRKRTRTGRGPYDRAQRNGRGPDVGNVVSRWGNGIILKAVGSVFPSVRPPVIWLYTGPRVRPAGVTQSSFRSTFNSRPADLVHWRG